MSIEKQREFSSGKNMHGREKGPKGANKGLKKRAPRYRMNIDLGEVLGKALDAKLAQTGMSQVEYVRSVVTAKLAKQSPEKAIQKLASNTKARERQEILNYCLYVANCIHGEPLFREPKRPLDEHIDAVLASETIRKIGADLLTLIRNVTAGKDSKTLLPPSSPDFKYCDMSSSLPDPS